MCEIVRINICEMIYEWIFSDKKMADYFRFVMNIPQKDEYIADFAPDCTVKVNTNDSKKVFLDQYNDATLKTKKSAIYLSDKSVECYLDVERIREPESLYYFLINPVLIHVFALNNKLYIHGACIGMEDKGVCILGPRNSGKTTLSIMALLKGYQLLTDDCIFVDSKNIARSFYRPLHVHPALGKKLHIEDRLLECKPYMNDEIELNYRIEKYHPKQAMDNKKLDVLIFPSVTALENTIVNEIIDRQEKKRRIIECVQYSTVEKMINDSLNGILENLIDLPAYEVSLGKNLFENYEVVFDNICNIANL